MSAEFPSPEEQERLGAHDKRDLAGDERRERSASHYLEILIAPRRWELLQRKISFGLVNAFAFGSMAFLFCFLWRVVSTDGANMGQWGVASLSIGIIGQSAFLMHSTIPKSRPQAGGPSPAQAAELSSSSST